MTQKTRAATQSEIASGITNATATASITPTIEGGILADIADSAFFPLTDALTGDVSTTAGSLATTLATVNSNVGTFGSSTLAPVLTVNAKGLITAVSTAAITGGSATSPAGTTGAIQYNNGGSFGGLNGTGLLKSNGAGAPTIGAAGTDYQAPITLTTTGTSGAATFSGNTLNVPQYTGGGGSGTVNSGTANQMAFYSSTGAAVSGDPNLTDNAGVWTHAGSSYTATITGAYNWSTGTSCTWNMSSSYSFKISSGSKFVLSAGLANFSVPVVLQRPWAVSTGTAGMPQALLVSNTFTVYTNTGQGAETYQTLPSAVTGYTYTFAVHDAIGMRIVAASGQTIRIGASVSASGGYLESTTPGSVITIIAISSTEWFASSLVGTWSVT